MLTEIRLVQLATEDVTVAEQRIVEVSGSVKVTPILGWMLGLEYLHAQETDAPDVELRGHLYAKVAVF